MPYSNQQTMQQCSRHTPATWQEYSSWHHLSIQAWQGELHLQEMKGSRRQTCLGDASEELCNLGEHPTGLIWVLTMQIFKIRPQLGA